MLETKGPRATRIYSHACTSAGWLWSDHAEWAGWAALPARGLRPRTEPGPVRNTETTSSFPLLCPTRLIVMEETCRKHLSQVLQIEKKSHK